MRTNILSYQIVQLDFIIMANHFEAKKFSTALILRIEDEAYEPFYTDGSFVDQLVLKYKGDTMYLYLGQVHLGIPQTVPTIRNI